MFAKKTVIILGAGASYCHGLPLGADLKNQIISLSESIGTRSEFAPNASPIDNLINTNFRDIDPPDWFRDRPFHLRFSRGLSSQVAFDTIDSFLLRNPSFSEIGRFYISYLILIETYQRQENSSVMIELKPDILSGRDIGETGSSVRNIRWYPKLVRHIVDYCQSPKELANNNQLNIVTFNYDRTLEHYLEQKLFEAEQFSAPNSGVHCTDVVSIHHVYGAVEQMNVGDGKGIEFGLRSVLSALTGIDTISIIDRTRNDKNISLIRHHLQQAEQVIIAGFAFDQDNCRVLDVPHLISNSSVRYHLFERNRVTLERLNEWESDKEEPLTFNGHICDQIDEGLFGINSR